MTIVAMLLLRFCPLSQLQLNVHVNVTRQTENGRCTRTDSYSDCADKTNETTWRPVSKELSIDGWMEEFVRLLGCCCCHIWTAAELAH